MSDTKRNHIVPRARLKYWANDDDRLLHVYQPSTKATFNKKININDFVVENRLYAQPIENMLARSFDQPYIQIVEFAKYLVKSFPHNQHVPIKENILIQLESAKFLLRSIQSELFRTSNFHKEFNDTFDPVREVEGILNRNSKIDLNQRKKIKELVKAEQGGILFDALCKSSLNSSLRNIVVFKSDSRLVINDNGIACGKIISGPDKKCIFVILFPITPDLGMIACEDIDNNILNFASDTKDMNQWSINQCRALVAM